MTDRDGPNTKDSANHGERPRAPSGANQRLTQGGNLGTPAYNPGPQKTNSGGENVRDVERAAKEHRRLLPIFKALFWVTNPVPIKYAVNRAGFNAGSPRLPMVEPDDDFKARFNLVMDRYDVDLPVAVAAAT